MYWKNADENRRMARNRYRMKMGMAIDEKPLEVKTDEPDFKSLSPNEEMKACPDDKEDYFDDEALRRE